MAARLNAQIAGRVKGPAIALMVTAIIGILAQLAGLATRLSGMTPPVVAQPGGSAQTAQIQSYMALMTGPIANILGIIALLMGVLVLFAALKMKKLQQHKLAVTASILAMIPLLSPCCFLGLPFGIWALVVLLKPEVKAAFH